MEAPKIVKKDEIEMNPLPFGGGEGDAGIWSMIPSPSGVMVFGTSEVNPGFAAHRWHSHTVDTVEEVGLEVIYHKECEEIYYIISGSGVVQWESEDGNIKEEKVSGGDVVFFPVGVAKHQLLNDGSEKIVMAWTIAPPPQIVQK